MFEELAPLDDVPDEGEGFCGGYRDGESFARGKRCFAGYGDGAVGGVPGNVGALAVAGLFDDDRFGSANPTGIVFGGNPLEGFCKGGGTLVLDAVGNGALHIECGGVRARHEAGNVADCRAGLSEDIQGVLKVPLGFAGESDDEVGAEGK